MTGGSLPDFNGAAKDLEGDPVVVHPSDPHAGSQAGLNGPSGSPTSPSKRDPNPLPDYMRVWRSPSVGWAWECRECPYGTRSAHLTDDHAREAAKQHVSVFHPAHERGYMYDDVESGA